VSCRPISYRIADFREWNERGELVLVPEFQRRPVWHSKARSYLIDTIIRGLPIPPIYVREVIDPRTQKVIREVIDGQQRLRAVLDFIAGPLKIQKTHNQELAGKSFRNLSEEDRGKFLRYAFSVNLVEQANYEDILDIFARINSYTMTLNRQERLNAKYFGEFKTTVYRLGREYASFWKENGILTDRQIVRMTEAELVSELLVAMLDGLQDKKKSLEKFYEKYDDQFPQRRQLENRFKRCMSTIGKIFGSELSRLAFKRRALFYSLFCVIYDLLYGLRRSRSSRYDIPRKKYLAIRRAMRKLSDQINADVPDGEYVAFVHACTRQTDNLKPRQIRHETIRKEFQAAIRSS